MKANIKYHEDYIKKLNKSKNQLQKSLYEKNLIKREINDKINTIVDQLKDARKQFDEQAQKIHEQQGQEYHIKVLVNQKIYERDVQAYNLDQIASQKANIKQLDQLKQFLPNDQEALQTIITMENKKKAINMLQKQKKEAATSKINLQPIERQIKKLQYDEQHYRYMLSDIETQIQNIIAGLNSTDELIDEQQKEVNHCKFKLATEIIDEFNFRK